MDKSNSTMAEQIARAASASQQQRTGLAPASVTVVLSEDTLVITLHGALSAGETVLLKSPLGAAQVQEFHRELFNNSCEPLRQEIEKITGVEVGVDGKSGAVVLATGTIVQVFLLAHGVPARTAGKAVDRGSRPDQSQKRPREDQAMP